MGLDLTGVGSVFDFAKGITDKIWPPSASPEDRLKATSEMAAAIRDRDSKRDGYKRDIIVAEMNQSDNYTKRARPSVVYGGLTFIALNHVLFPFLIALINIAVVLGVGSITPEQAKQISELGTFELPGHFWLAWSGICSVYSWGRSQEKKGPSENELMNKLVSTITGNKK